jgi:hypothetical protein
VRGDYIDVKKLIANVKGQPRKRFKSADEAEEAPVKRRSKSSLLNQEVCGPFTRQWDEQSRLDSCPRLDGVSAAFDARSVPQYAQQDELLRAKSDAAHLAYLKSRGDLEPS